MKQFFKMMFASALGVFIGIGILTLVSFILLVGMIASLSSSSVTYVPGYDVKVLRIPFMGSLTEVASENRIGSLFGSESSSSSLQEILSAIREAKDDDRIEGIFLDVASLSTGTAGIDVIRRTLTEFREESGKFVVAYADSYTQKGYYLSSVADKVFLNPQGVLQLTGLASQTIFYKGLLKKAGLEMQIFKVGTYKGAVEPFMLDKLSEENREQIASYQQCIWKHIVSGIASARNVEEDHVRDFIDRGYMFAPAEKAVECGFVDELKYREEVEDYLKERTGVEADRRLKTISVAQMKSMKKRPPSDAKKTDLIAVVYAEGEIMDSDNTPEYSRNGYITEKLVEELISLKRDDRVKAVVMRVNSPGGSAYLSEQIWKQVSDIKKDKKMVVSMGNVAASGGYYISCAADRIISEANTLTGSIGVFGMFPNAAGLFDKMDLTAEVVKTNNYSDLGDLSRPMRDDEKALLQGYVEHTYDVFLTRCSEGRGCSKQEIDAVGQGRVWTGEQALEKGLVDEIGDLDRAVEVAAELAGLTDYSLKTVSGSSVPIMEYLKKQIGEVKSTLIKNALGEDLELFRMLKTIKQTGGIQARLPYDFEAL